MTLGEKIIFYRKQLDISQYQLSVLSRIPLDTLKQYETDKRQPTAIDLKQLATVLEVHPKVFANDKLSIETAGELLGLLLRLCNANVLQLAGERDCNCKIKKETLSVQVNPEIVEILKQTQNFIEWEQLKFLEENIEKEPNILPVSKDELTSLKEKEELFLQQSKLPIDWK